MTNFDYSFRVLSILALLVNLDCLSASPIVTRPKQDSVEGVEHIAKLLIGLDQGIEKAMLADAAPWSHLYLAPSEEALGNNTQDNGDREEKFSLVLQDLNKIEDHIKDAISKANTNRQYRLVMRLRPLLSYVTHIHRNMEMLRTRVVAIATLSNLAVTVTEVIDQFGDVMTSSLGLASGIVPPKDKPSSTANPTEVAKGNNETLPLASSAIPDVPTTLSYTEVDSENFLKNIINLEIK